MSGDKLLEYSQIKNIINSDNNLQIYKKIHYQDRETVLFYNPNLRSYYSLNYITESSLDWNLQRPLTIKTSAFNYMYHILDTLDYSRVISPIGKVYEGYCKFFPLIKRSLRQIS